MNNEQLIIREMYRLLFVVPLAVMIRTDVRERVVPVWALAVFGALQYIIGMSEEGIRGAGERVLLNGGVLLFLGAGVCGYLGLRYGFRVLPRFIGSGDIWFVLCLLPAFPFPLFPRFLVVAFGVSLAVWAIERYGKGKDRTIPLVATMGGCYLFYLFFI